MSSPGSASSRPTRYEKDHNVATGTQIEVVMPQMGVSVSEGTITKWLKQPGEAIAQDEPLLEISTDKVDTEVPSPGEGVVAEILVAEGETVDVGTLLAVIAPAGSAVAEPAAAARCRACGRSAGRAGTRASSGGRERARRGCRPCRRRPRPATAAPSSRPSWPGSPPSRVSTRAPSPAPGRVAA